VTTIAFRPAFRVTVEEDGTGRTLDALAFAPTAATAARLRDHRLTFRPRPGGFALYAQLVGGAGGTRRAPMAAPVSMIFGIRLMRSDFLARYHPDLTAATGPNLYLTNRSAGGGSRASGSLARGATVEAADAVRIVDRRLTARVDRGATPAPRSLVVAPLFDPRRGTAEVPLPAGAGVASVAVDLRDSPERAFTLAPKPGGRVRSAIFVDDELAGRGAFGVLELIAEPRPGREPTDGRAYVARFRRRG
jgi:hypothetical protein